MDSSVPDSGVELGFSVGKLSGSGRETWAGLQATIRIQPTRRARFRIVISPSIFYIFI
jgi:hypothetical protein